MNELALFAGAGGGILGGKLLGWRTVCAVERDAYAAQVLAQRQNDGILEAFPIWSDVQTFDGKPWREIVDIISGGFPCQDISVAGKGAGIEGEKSGMWKEFLRIIGDIRPRFVFVENSPMLTSRGLGVVLGDLAAAGYDAEWTCLSAAEVGANHVRDRIWILANADSKGSKGGHIASGIQKKIANIDCASWWKTEPEILRVVDGMAARMDFVNDQLKAIGNGQVPLAAATAFIELINKFAE
jgi:DNA (cytosine-5)-methyltransferase 1